MRKYYPGTKIVDYLGIVQCNMCGKEMDVEHDEYEEFMLDNIHEFKVGFGYGSALDGQSWKFDLCDKCLGKLVDSFIVPVDIDRWI